MAVVDGQSGERRNYILGAPKSSVLGPLIFILYTHMLFGLEKCLYHILMMPL